MPWTDALRRAEQLSADYAERIGTRATDTLSRELSHWVKRCLTNRMNKKPATSWWENDSDAFVGVFCLGDMDVAPSVFVC
jgi:hypothetical protein